MDSIDEKLFSNREKVKSLVRQKKKGRLLAKEIGVPLDRLLEYKKRVKEDLDFCTTEIEFVNDIEEYEFLAKKSLGKKVICRLIEDNKDKFKQISDHAKQLARSTPDPSDRPLKAPEMLFVKHYVTTKKQTQAAKMAGYANPAESASQLLRRPHIHKAISIEVAKSLEGVMTPDQVLENLKMLYERSIQAHPIVDSDGHYLGEWAYDPKTAIKAIELIGKYWKLFTDRVEHTGANGGPIQHEVKVEYDYSALTVEEHREFNRLRKKIKTIEVVPEKV